MEFVPSKYQDTKVWRYYLYDKEKKENIAQYNVLSDCQKDCRKMNKNLPNKRYISKGSFYISKTRN